MRFRRMRTGISIKVQPAINRFPEEHNGEAKPADPDKIIAAVKRGRQALGSFHSFNNLGRICRPGQVSWRAIDSFRRDRDDLNGVAPISTGVVDIFRESLAG